MQKKSIIITTSISLIVCSIISLSYIQKNEIQNLGNGEYREEISLGGIVESPNEEESPIENKDGETNLTENEKSSEEITNKEQTIEEENKNSEDTQNQGEDPNNNQPQETETDNSNNEESLEGEQIIKTASSIIYGDEEYEATLEGSDGEMNNFKFKTITIGNQTILDRNLGATETRNKNLSSGNRNSYGYYYQWGNNYGFSPDPSAAISKTTTRVDASPYGPENPYSSSTFIKTNGDDRSSVQNDNLRGGEGDDETNGYGLTSNNLVSNRRGPCPDGYHVPSLGDWNELIVQWYNDRYHGNLNTGDLFYLTSTGSVSGLDALTGDTAPVALAFSEDLLIPFAGIRWYDDGTVETSYIGLIGMLWSSTPDDVYADHLSLMRTARGKGENRERFFKVAPDYDYRGEGGSVRCFKNRPQHIEIPKILTLNAMTGETVVSTGISFTNSPLTAEQVSGAISWISTEIELATGYHLNWYSDNEGTETEFDLDTAISEGSITDSLTLTGKIEANKYTISFLDEVGNELMSEEFTFDLEAPLPLNTTTKEGYIFKGWQDEQGNTYNDGESIKNLTTENNAILKFTSIRKQEEVKPSENIPASSGGSGRPISKPEEPKSEKPENTEEHGSADSEESEEPENINEENIIPDGLEIVNYNPDLPANQQTLSDGLTPEMHDAYKFAYEHRITTKPNIIEADMYGPLDRISMAKMLSNYAINILGMLPDTNRINQFADVPEELNEEFNNGVTLAYQLGIMGINMPNNEFRPYDLVPRREFATALSRMLYKIPDGRQERAEEYYTPHFSKLKEEGILSVLDPDIEELRGYVMIMLKRSAKK